MREEHAAPELRVEKPTADVVAGLLSYLVPGLGQIYQGRLLKGVVFLVCLYTLFFYGLYLGNWQNVYVFASPPEAANAIGPRPSVWGMVADRARFFAQAWIGVAAWPAIWQYATFNPREEAHPILGKFERMPSEEEQKDILRNSDKSPDVAWVYTVIAAVLNILVIYDAYAGPVYPGRPPFTREQEKKEARS